MLTRFQFWLLTAAGGLAVVLVAVNMYLFQGNRVLQGEASSRAQFIQESIALENLYREIVQGLADRAVRTRDEQVRELLAAEGFNVTFEPPPASGEQR